MVRRTKEEALATRHRLLDAAEHLFQEHGVSRTSLNDIAQAAGATRGAIYWHFKDKADLFNAMMDRVAMPLEDMARKDAIAADPVQSIRASMATALRKVTSDPQVQRVFDVATHKVEYVEEMKAVRERHLAARDGCMNYMQQALRQAARLRGVKLAVPVQTAVLGLHALADGLIQNWLLDPGAFDLVATGRRSLDVYLAGLGLMEPPPPVGAAPVVAQSMA